MSCQHSYPLVHNAKRTYPCVHCGEAYPGSLQDWQLSVSAPRGVMPPPPYVGKNLYEPRKAAVDDFDAIAKRCREIFQPMQPATPQHCGQTMTLVGENGKTFWRCSNTTYCTFTKPTADTGGTIVPDLSQSTTIAEAVGDPCFKFGHDVGLRGFCQRCGYHP